MILIFTEDLKWAALKALCILTGLILKMILWSFGITASIL